MINRNRNHKLGKVILFTFYDDGPLVVQDDFTTEVQTDTRSLGSGLRGEERFEYLGFDVVLDADAEVDEEIREIMDDLKSKMCKIEENGNRASSIVRGILLYSRGKDDEYLATDLCQLTKEYVWLSYHAVRAKTRASMLPS